MKSRQQHSLYYGVAISGVSFILLLSGCGSNNAALTTQISQPSKTTLNITSPSVVTTTAVDSPTPVLVSSPSTRAEVGLVLSKETVKAGEVFTAEVLVKSLEEVRGGSCDLSFDPALLECTKVEEGGFLRDFAESQGMSTINMPKAKIDSEAGEITGMGIFIAGRLPTGAKGQGVLCVYHFKALKDGVPAPRITKITLGGVGENDTSKEIITRIK
jgi:hypothetical protein